MGKSVWQCTLATQMKNGILPVTSHQHASARVAARFHPRWLRIYVSQKLWSDPVYPATFALLRESNEPILDVGCGLGLLAFYLRERGFHSQVTGLDCDARKIRRATHVAAFNYDGVDFLHRDVRDDFSFTGNILLFDVLHYLPPADQRTLLKRLAAYVAPGGYLMIRDCPADRTTRFWLTYIAEFFAQSISWNLTAPLHFPSRETICNAFEHKRFLQRSEPLWGQTPFNNHLFIFQRHAEAIAPAQG